MAVEGTMGIEGFRVLLSANFIHILKMVLKFGLI